MGKSGLDICNDELFDDFPEILAFAHFESGFFKIDRISKCSGDSDCAENNFIDMMNSKSFEELVYTPDRKVIIDEYNRVKKSAKKNGSTDFRVCLRDGIIRWFNMKFHRLSEVDGISYYCIVFNDINKYKKTELDIIKAGQMYDNAAAEAKLIIWEYDIKTKQAAFIKNRYMEKICRKYALPDVLENIPDSLTQYVDDRDKKSFIEVYRKINDGEDYACCEFRFKMPDHEAQQYERMSLRRITDADGNLITVHCCGQNITLMKRAEMEYIGLRRHLSENLHDVVGSFYLDLSQNRYINGYSSYPGVVESLKRKTADEHFAATAETVISENIKKRILENYVCEKLIERYRGGQKQIECDYPVYTSKGGVMWVHSILHMMLNPESGNVEGITYSKDVTKQKRNEEILRKISSNSCDYVGVLDLLDFSFEMSVVNWECDVVTAGNKVPYNDVRNMLAYSYMKDSKRNEFLRKTSCDKIIEILNKKTQHIVTFDFYDIEKPEEKKKKQVVFSWINEEHREILIIQQDVTAAYEQEEKQSEQMRRAVMEAAHANEMKTEFLSNLSHDMRTPLNAILGYAGFAMKTDNADEVKEYIKKITQAGNILLTLINDTLDLSKIENGSVTLKKNPIGCGEVIERVIASIRPDVEKKHINLVIDNRRAVMATINIDALRVQEIFINLISNAIKFTPEYGEILFIVECVKLEKNCVHDRITVRDNGCGMSREFLEKIYEPFTQERLKGNTESSGSGLGLSIVKRLVDLMGGTIEVKSEPGKGSEFSVYLDFERVDDQEVHTQINTGKDLNLEGKRILICEDNAMNREIAVRLLEFKGVKTEITKNGKDGLDAFENSEIGYYDAVLMDIRMPEMNGYEATENIRKLERSDAKTIPIIAMTADAFDDDVQKCIEAGMNGHISKPIDPNVLYHVISENFINKGHRDISFYR